MLGRNLSKFLLRNHYVNNQFLGKRLAQYLDQGDK